MASPFAPVTNARVDACIDAWESMRDEIERAQGTSGFSRRPWLGDELSLFYDDDYDLALTIYRVIDARRRRA